MTDRGQHARSRLLHVFAACGIVFMIVAALYVARVVFVPVVIALLLTFVASPLMSCLQRWHWKRVPAALVVVLLLCVAIGAILMALFVQAGRLAAELPTYKEQIVEKIQSVREMSADSWLNRFILFVEDLINDIQQTPTSEVVPVSVQTGPLSGLPLVAGSAFEVLVEVGLILVLVFFMLLRREEFRNRLIRLGDSQLTTTTHVMDEGSERISKYLQMQLVVNVCYGAAWSIGFLIIGVPYALTWGFVAAALRYVPYLGWLIAAIFPALISFAVFSSWTPFIFVIGYILLVEILVSNLLEPLLYGKTTGVSDLALLLAAAFWTWMWGPIGLVLATPIITCVFVLCRHVHSLQFVAVLLGDEPTFDPPAVLYQRLLARDLDEAREIIENQLQEHSPTDTYEELLRPVLIRMRSDKRSGTLRMQERRWLAANLRELARSEGPDRAHMIADEHEPAHRLVIGGVPAQDSTDRLALYVFQNLLDPELFEFKVISADPRDRTRQEFDVLLVATLSSHYLSHTRHLCKQLRVRFPDKKLLVGCWGLAGDMANARDKLKDAGADDAAASFPDSLAQLSALAGQRDVGLTPAGAAS
jgi:predicted PurR-regulated permease PerM